MVQCWEVAPDLRPSFQELVEYFSTRLHVLAGYVTMESKEMEVVHGGCADDLPPHAGGDYQSPHAALPGANAENTEDILPHPRGNVYQSPHAAMP